MMIVVSIACLVGMLALLEGVCIFNDRKLKPKKHPIPCYLVLSILADETDWQARLNGLMAQIQWMDHTFLTGIYVLLPTENAALSYAIQQYCSHIPLFQCGDMEGLENILTDSCFHQKNDCILSK